MPPARNMVVSHRGIYMKTFQFCSCHNFPQVERKIIFIQTSDDAYSLVEEMWRIIEWMSLTWTSFSLSTFLLVSSWLICSSSSQNFFS